MTTIFPNGRERIIASVMGAPNKEIKVRELASKLELSPAHVSRTVKKLRDQGVVNNHKVDLSSPYAGALKILFNIIQIDFQHIRCAHKA